MEAEVAAAIISACKSDATIVASVGSTNFFVGRAKDATLPAVVFFPIASGANLTMGGDGDWEESIVQASVWDKGPAWTTVEAIKSDLDLLFHRGTLALSSKTFISMDRVGESGPDWVEDAWQRTVDYRIRYK